MSVKINENTMRLDVNMNEVKYINSKIVDMEEHINCVIFGELANCIDDSLDNYYKLKRVGAVRVRGKRYLEREKNDPKAFHYWVESKGYVFDKHGGVQTIVDKESYYKVKKITDVEIAEYSGFFRDELLPCDRLDHNKSSKKSSKKKIEKKN